MRILVLNLLITLCLMGARELILPAGIHWRPNNAGQREALSREEYELLVGGSRGGGKTEAGIVWMVEAQYIRNPRYRGLVVRKQVKDLTDWIDKAKVMYRPLEANFVGNAQQGAVEIQFPWGSIIRTGHLRDRDAYQSYMGQEYQKVNFEELTQVAQEEWYLMVLASARSTIPGLKPQVWASANPGNIGHAWCKSRFVDVARNKPYKDPKTGLYRVFIPFAVYDNPHIMQYNPEYVRYLEGLPEKLRAAWLDGDWGSFVGQFFHRFDVDVHVTRPFVLPDGYLRYRGLDWGDSSPSCVLWVAVGYDGTHYIYRELYEKRLTPQQLAQRVLRMTDANEHVVQTWADPNSIKAVGQYGTGNQFKAQSNKTIGDLLAEQGLFCSPASNDRVAGWQAINQLMDWEGDPSHIRKKPKLVIFDTCVNLIRTLPTLVHDERRVEDVDTNGEDHPADALRYAIMHTVSASQPEVVESRNVIEDLLHEAQVAHEEMDEHELWGWRP